MSVKGQVYLRLQFNFRECPGRTPQSMEVRGDNIPEDVSGGSMLQCADNQQLYINPLKAPQSMAVRGDIVYMGPTLQCAESQKSQIEPKM